MFLWVVTTHNCHKYGVLQFWAATSQLWIWQADEILEGNYTPLVRNRVRMPYIIFYSFFKKIEVTISKHFFSTCLILFPPILRCKSMHLKIIEYVSVLLTKAFYSITKLFKNDAKSAIFQYANTFRCRRLKNLISVPGSV